MDISCDHLDIYNPSIIILLVYLITFYIEAYKFITSPYTNMEKKFSDLRGIGIFFSGYVNICHNMWKLLKMDTYSESFDIWLIYSHIDVYFTNIYNMLLYINIYLTKNQIFTYQNIHTH